MDSTYVTIMLVVFLVLTGLAIDIGYMYVSEEDLQGAAESAALAGVQTIKQRMLLRMQEDPGKIGTVSGDRLQAEARSAAVEAVSGKHNAAALVDLANNNGNALTGDNDVTVGFWNLSSRSYTAGGTPVNAMQVRTRRTAESSSVGMGALGSFLAKISGTVTFGSTPVAIAAIPVGTRSNLALCSDACDASCSYPQICSIKEKKMSRASGDPAGETATGGRYLYTSLLHPATITNPISEMVCQESPPQEVCGKPIYTTAGTGDATLRDIKAMMYNPKLDASNKEHDKNGKLKGWWVLAPVTDCAGLKAEEVFRPRTVSRYSLVRISRICLNGVAGCNQAGAPADASATPCSAGEDGLYIDRISCVGCGSKATMLIPGLYPVLVDQAER